MFSCSECGYTHATHIFSGNKFLSLLPCSQKNNEKTEAQVEISLIMKKPKKYFSKKRIEEKIKPINLCPSTVNIIVFSLKVCKIAKYYPSKCCKFIQANADVLACTDLIKNWNSISVAYRFSSSGTEI